MEGVNHFIPDHHFPSIAQVIILFFYTSYFIFWRNLHISVLKQNVSCNAGDVCKGDVVLFRQKVHKKQGNIVGKRTVAGRIVKESYGASKQQHTFTVRQIKIV